MSTLKIITIDRCIICHAKNVLGESASELCAECIRDECYDTIRNAHWHYDDHEWADSMKLQARECLVELERALHQHKAG